MKHTWLKLLTALFWSKKFRGLPDNDHRICYIGHLILAKMGIEDESFEFISSTFFVSKTRYKRIRKSLVSIGLLDDQGIVIGFEESQLTPAALRMRRHRDVTSDVTVTQQVTGIAESRKQKADKEGKGKEAFPPVSFASDSQIETMTEMSTERGLVFADVLKSLGLEKARSCDVTSIMAHIRETKRVDAGAVATDARNAALRLLKGQLDKVYQRKGAVEARVWIGDQSKTHQSPLSIYLKEMQADYG